MGLGAARYQPTQRAANEHHASSPGSLDPFTSLDHPRTVPSRSHRSMIPAAHGLPLPPLRPAALTQDNLKKHESSLRMKVERKYDVKPSARQYAHNDKARQAREKKRSGRGHNRVTKKEQKERKPSGHRHDSTKKEEKIVEKPFSMEDLEEGEIYEGPSGLLDTDEPPPRPVINKQKLDPELKYDDDEQINMNKIPCYKGIPGLGNYIKEE